MGKDDEDKRRDDMTQISSIFPSADKAVIEAVYESNSYSLELTVNDLLKMMEPAPATAPLSRKLSASNQRSSVSKAPSSAARGGKRYSTTVPVPSDITTVIGEETTLPPSPPQQRMTIEEQIAVDEALALKLQQREAERHHANEVTREIAEKLGIDPDDSECCLHWERLNNTSHLDSEPGDELKFIAEMAKQGI